MAGLFSGKPLTATSYAQSSSETPKWFQDAIYNQQQLAQNAAAIPFQSYDMPRVAELSPLQQDAYRRVQQNVGAWQPTYDKAVAQYGTASGGTTANVLRDAQNQYLRPDLAQNALNRGQDALTQAAGYNAVNAAQPWLQQAGQTTQQSISERALAAANPYLQQSGQSSVQGINQYMNPYNTQVTDRIAQLGARNLSESLLPEVSDAFIRAGQFGSSRMGEFGSRALRDTQEAILGQQAQALQQGYGQALGASQADLARQAQLGQIAGNIAGSDLGRIQTAGAQYGNLGQTAGNLTAQQMQNLTSLGNTQSGIGYNQQALGLDAANRYQQALAGDYERQMLGASGLADLARTGQGLRASDTAALEGAGAAQQQQLQRQLDAAYGQFMEEQNYPFQRLDWLNNQIRGIQPAVPTTQTSTSTQSGGGAGYAPSPLSQLASGYFAYKGLSGG